MNIDGYRMSRRAFVSALASAAAVISIAPSLLRAADKSLISKPIPATGERLPVIGLGTSRTFDVGNDQIALADLAEVLKVFFDSGGKLIDSSPMYGTAEQVVGRLQERLAIRDNQLFAATKVWTDGRQQGLLQMEKSLRQWQLKRFDLMQIHNLRDWQTHLTTLKAWQDEGRIRYTGITTSHGRFHRELEEILRRERLDFVQFSYNLENRDVEERLLPLATDRGMAVLINRPYQRGALFRRVKGKVLPEWASEIDCSSWAQFFLKFIASHPAVTCVIPATSKVRHMHDNMAAGFGRLPDAAMRKRMIAYFEAL